MKRFWIFLALMALILPGAVGAEKFESPGNGFSIEVPKGWLRQPTAYEGVLMTFWKEGTVATFHVTERDLEGAKTVSDLKWEDLFSPKFEEINIRQEAETMINGEKARYCIYKIRPGSFKQEVEGKGDFKYMNYLLVHNGRLYSVTFKDLESSFSIDYPGFLSAVRSIRFTSGKTGIQPATTEERS